MTSQETNRDRFKKLCAKADISQQQAAELIAKVTERPCSVRTVRTWLADPSRSTAQPCPDWAVKALLKALETQTGIAQRWQRRSPDGSSK